MMVCIQGKFLEFVVQIRFLLLQICGKKTTKNDCVHPILENKQAIVGKDIVGAHQSFQSGAHKDKRIWTAFGKPCSHEEKSMDQGMSLMQFQSTILVNYYH